MILPHLYLENYDPPLPDIRKIHDPSLPIESYDPTLPDIRNL